MAARDKGVAARHPRRPGRGPARGPSEGSARDQASRLEGLAGYLAEGSARDFDRLVYERVRLGIMSALAVNEEMSFIELRELLGASDGNLSVHARKLEDAGYVVCRKTFAGRVPRTVYSIAPAGRRALERYLDHMEAIIGATRGG